MRNVTIFRQTLLCITAMIFGGLLAVYYGRELCWDLAHYHYYIPFALLHQRYSMDYWPASYIHQFLNPTIDLLTYGLITYISPYRAVFILGALHGINLWLLYRIARRLVHETYAKTTSLILAALGLLGPTTLPGMGSFQNDNLICVFVLAFFLLTIRLLQSQPQQHFSKVFTLSAGLLLGLGIGLKLTAATYFVAAVLAVPFMPVSLKTQIQWLIIFCVGILIGVLITSGYWMWMMWEQYHNPVFPFFNTWFKSPDFAPISWRDRRFLPTTWLQTWFYPFYFSWDGRIADAPFRDIRFAILYLLILPTILLSFRKPLPPLLRWITAFTVAAYIVWQVMFSIARYLAPLEMLTPILIYLLLHHWIQNVYIRSASLVVIFTIIMMVFSPIPMIRMKNYSVHFFNVELPRAAYQHQQATVLIAYTAFVQDLNPRPQTYLIPFFPKDWRFIGIPFSKRQFIADDKLHAHLRDFIQNNTQPIYLLTAAPDMPELYRAASQFGLSPAGTCDIIKSDRQAVTRLTVLLCPVQVINRMHVEQVSKKTG